MKAPRLRIAEVVAKQSLASGFSSSQATNLAAYLLQERRVSELDSLLRDISMSWVEHGYIEVIASSAHKINETVRKEIHSEVRKLYPGAKQIHITEQIEPDLIGGVSLEFANRRLDLSIRADLNKFKIAAVNGKD